MAEESPVASHGVYVQPKNSRAAEFYRSAGFLDLESNSNNPSYSMFLPSGERFLIKFNPAGTPLPQGTTVSAFSFGDGNG
ncbi:MAG: hypothetical protein ACLVAP_13355 [Parasutterella sp.]